MKHCPKCNRQYYDPSLNFCTEDGTPLTPRYDTEAETLKNVPKKPPLSSQDIVMEIADALRGSVGPDDTLIRFELLTGRGLAVTEISEHFHAAAAEAGCEVITKTETRATVRRKAPEITFRHSGFDID